MCWCLKVGSVMFTPGHLTCLLTLGVYTGLVMDVGYTETLVVPVSLILNVNMVWHVDPKLHRYDERNIEHKKHRSLV